MIFRPLDTPLEAKTQSDTHSIVRYSGDLQCVRISARFWGIFTVKSDWLVYCYKEVNKFWLALDEMLRTGNFEKSHSEPAFKIEIPGIECFFAWNNSSFMIATQIFGM